MVDQTLPSDRPADPVCPWCSASLAPDAETCPSCGAILNATEEPDLPGVTAVDANLSRGEKTPSRSRLMSWISGEYSAETVLAEGDAQAIAPPDPEVQREMLRLRLEAEVANLQAEADSLMSEAVIEGRLAELPEDVQPMAEAEFGEPTGDGENEADTAEAGTAEADTAEAATADATPTATTDATPTEGEASAEDAPPPA